MKNVFFLMLVWMASPVYAANETHVPTIDELLRLKTVGGARISPDGRWIAYTVTETDFDEDAFVTHIWLAPTDSKTCFQLTRGTKSASNPKWSPDGVWLAFVSSRNGGVEQVFLISPTGGEAVQLTRSKTDVTDFQWSPDGKRMAYAARDPEPESLENRKEHMAEFAVVRKEYLHTHIWLVDVAAALEEPSAGAQLTTGKELSVRDFAWSPDGARIAFGATKDPDFINSGTEDVYLLSVEDRSVNRIVSQPGPDGDPHWSPDGKTILFSTVMGAERYYPLNNELAVVPAEGGEPRVLAQSFDEEMSFVAWNRDGIYFEALQKTTSHLFRLDPATETVTRVSQPATLMGSFFTLTSDGKSVAFCGESPTSLREVYVSSVEPFQPEALTTLTAQVDDLILGQSEIISWKSHDGTVIEGVLLKPADFNPGQKAPLLCVIHGGPTGIDRPAFRGNRYYPVDIWAGRGALVLRVNYRGSAGYGEAFRKLNLRNLGVGDAWDVLSGVDYLIEKGWVDPKRVGCMGWSQGGYISAFLTASSDRFAAISVGAGISNWATYYYNTDITPFTINYLGGDPVEDPAVYQKTSPMSYIQKASTPTLIQHGENDRRVPIPNAYELRQALQDRGVPAEMVVYKGFGHGINKPKSQRAVMWHNLVWFNHFLWGDPLPNLARPDVPATDR